MTRQPEVVFPPQSLRLFQRGFDTLAEVLAVTLGPHQGTVFHANEFKPRPEVLTDAATIARRITELGEPEENMGAMLLRNLVWRMKERVGDGAATAAVLAQAMLRRTQKLAAAGANRMALVHGMSVGAKAAVRQLHVMSRPVESEEDLAAVARAVTGREELSWVLGEMFHILGPHAHITVEDYLAPLFERVYIDGGRWAAQLISPYLITAPAAGMGIQADVQVALYDGNLSQDDEVRPLLELVGRTQTKRLLLAAHKISGDALSLLTATHQQTELKIVAVNLTRAGEKALLDLQDLEALTGARLVSPQLGQKLHNISSEQLGHARRAEAGREDLFVTGGAGDPSVVRRQIELLHTRLNELPPGDDARPELELRLGRLSGSAGVLKIGAVSPTERDDLHQRAEQAVKALRMTLQDGLLPGGGAAYLQCIPPVETAAARLKADGDEDASLGAGAVALALAAPFQRILANAGIPNPGVYQNEICARPETFYDVETRSLRDAHQAGVLDATQVLCAALESAASGAMMALSTDTLVVKRKPKVSSEP